MPRTTNGPGIEELRATAKRMFPGRSAQIYATSKADLQAAINAGKLPEAQQVTRQTAIAPRPASIPSRPVPVSGTSASEAAQTLALAIESLTSGFERPVSEADVRCIAEDVFADMMEKQGPRKALTIRVNDLPPVSVDDQHERFPILLAITAARVPVMMVGPAGSGKTTAAGKVAETLSLPFHAISCNEQMSPAGLLGFVHANGGYVTTAFRQAYEFGGVFLLDEMDRGRPAVLAALNMALANGHMEFPDKMIARHPDFIPMAGCNTFGTGASREYVTAQQLDSSTLDRFFALEWNYDKSLTRALLGMQVTRKYLEPCKSGYTLESWVERVESVMDAISRTNARHLVTPRACLYGARLLDILPRELLEKGLLWKGANDATRQQLGGSI